MGTATFDMTDRVVLVTGATAGIGLEASRALARAGARLLLVGRNPERGARALALVREAAHPGAPPPELLLADLSSLAEVQRLAAEVRARHPRLDVLLNNAGQVYEQRTLTPEGHEATWATNHLAYFLLTHLLRPALEAAPRARVVNVASEAHRSGRIPFDDLTRERGYSAWGAYADSKLANILFTRALARRLAGTRVTTNALHPGVVRSHFWSHTGPALGLFARLASPFMVSSEEGARTSVYLAASPAVEGVSGEYFKRSQRARPRQNALDESTAERLWQVSAELTGVNA